MWESDEEIRRLGEVGIMAFRAGWAAAMASVLELPLEVFGRWERDTVYPPNAAAFHNGCRWLSMFRTASEPADDNAAWLRLPSDVNAQHIGED